QGAQPQTTKTQNPVIPTVGPALVEQPDPVTHRRTVPMSTKSLPQPRQRVRTRRISPSNPPASTYSPVYNFRECRTPGCRQLHVPAATGERRCPECLASEVRA